MHNSYRQSVSLQWPSVFLAAIATLLLVAALTPLNWRWSLGLAGFAALAVYAYAQGVSKKQREYLPAPWQLEVEPQQSHFVSPKDIDRLRHILVEVETDDADDTELPERESEWLWLSRQHPLFAAGRWLMAALLAVLAVALLASAAYFGTVHVSRPSHLGIPPSHTGTQPDNQLPSVKPVLPSGASKDTPTINFSVPHSLEIPWWLTVAAAMVLLLWAWATVWDWLYGHFLLITNQNLWLVRSPPPYLFFLEASEFPLGLEEIRLPAKQDTVAGNAFGWGTLELGTVMQQHEDSRFNRIQGIPGHADASQVLRAALRRRKESMAQSNL